MATQDRIEAEEELLSYLDSVSEATPETWDEVLHIVALLSALNTGSSRQRQAVSLLAPDVHTPTALIAAYLHETDPNAVGALRWSLAHTTEETTPLIMAHAGISVETDRRIIDALADKDSPDAADALRQFLDSSDTAVSSHAALTIGSLITQHTRMGPLLSASQDTLTESLITLIINGDHDVEAAESLGQLATTGETLASYIVTALRLRGESCIASTTSADTSVSIQLRVIQALAEIPGTAAQKALQSFSNAQDPRISETARYLLNR